MQCRPISRCCNKTQSVTGPWRPCHRVQDQQIDTTKQQQQPSSTYSVCYMHLQPWPKYTSLLPYNTTQKPIEMPFIGHANRRGMWSEGLALCPRHPSPESRPSNRARVLRQGIAFFLTRPVSSGTLGTVENPKHRP